MTIAMKILGFASLASAVIFIPNIATAETVCREECVGPICSQKCVETSDDRRESIEERREERRDEMLENRDEQRREEPSIELRTPGGDVEIRR